MTVQHNPEITRFIDVLAETGSHYRIEEMKSLYTEDLGFLVVTPEGSVARFSKEEILAEFSDRRDAGDPPLLTERRILHIEEQGNEATVLLYRRMSHEADPAMYELRLRKVDGRWQVSGETVSPWPDLSMAKGFLPPRKR